VTRRVLVGRDVRVVVETPDTVELESRVRLRPGQPVAIATAADNWPAAGRPAVVLSWRLTGLGTNGPLFRGICQWMSDKGNPLPG